MKTEKDERGKWVVKEGRRGIKVRHLVEPSAKELATRAKVKAEWVARG